MLGFVFDQLTWVPSKKNKVHQSSPPLSPSSFLSCWLQLLLRLLIVKSLNMGTFFVELLCRWVPNRHVVIIYRLKFFKLKRFTIEMKIYALYPSLWQVGKKRNDKHFPIYVPISVFKTHDFTNFSYLMASTMFENVLFLL